MGVHWLIIITLLFIYVQASIYKRKVLQHVEYHRFLDSDGVFEGQRVEMVEKIVNLKLLPVLWLRLECRMDKSFLFQKQSTLHIKHQQYHQSFFSLMPYTSIRRRHQLTCSKRGYYLLSSASMTSGDALGLRKVYKDFELNSKLLVYPKLIEMDQISLPVRSWLGNIIVKRWIVADPFITAGVKEYAPRDPFNRINWKATARTGRLQVLKSDFTSDSKVMLYLNFEHDEGAWDSSTNEELLEKGISYAASIARFLIEKGIETGFGCNGCLHGHSEEPIFIPPHCSKQHFTSLLEVMAKLLTKRSVTFFAFLEQAVKLKKTDILILTPTLSKSINQQIQKLKSPETSVKVLLLTNSGTTEVQPCA